MYETILIPVDTSPANEVAFRRARQLAEDDDTELILFHVVEMLQDVEYEEMQDFYDDLRSQAETKLSQWVADLTEDGLDARSAVDFGHRGPSIVEAVDEFDVDLIVLRSHIFDADDPEASLGTVSHQVGLFAPCSVLMVREET